MSTAPSPSGRQRPRAKAIPRGLCDRHPELAVAYTAGVPGDASLEHLKALAQHAVGVAVAPDADAGGVRIAEDVLGILDAPDVALLDVGTGGHQAISR